MWRLRWRLLIDRGSGIWRIFSGKSCVTHASNNTAFLVSPNAPWLALLTFVTCGWINMSFPRCHIMQTLLNQKRKTTKPVKCYFVLALIWAAHEVAFGSWGSVHVWVRFPVAESTIKKKKKKKWSHKKTDRCPRPYNTTYDRFLHDAKTHFLEGSCKQSAKYTVVWGSVQPFWMTALPKLLLLRSIVKKNKTKTGWKGNL